MKRWECGFQHHFIGPCSFHRSTFVKDLLVSTVGSYRRLPHGEEIEIGYGRLYESMVFPTNGTDDTAEGHPSVVDWGGLWTEEYNDPVSANVGHDALVARVLSGWDPRREQE